MGSGEGPLELIALAHSESYPVISSRVCAVIPSTCDYDSATLTGLPSSLNQFPAAALNAADPMVSQPKTSSLTLPGSARRLRAYGSSWRTRYFSMNLLTCSLKQTSYTIHDHLINAASERVATCIAREIDSKLTKCLCLIDIDSMFFLVDPIGTSRLIRKLEKRTTKM